MNHIITHVKKASLAKSIFGVALFLAGIILIGFGYLIPGIFFIGVGLSILTTKGAQLDVTNKKYREIKSVAGVHFGTWKPFPEFEYVSVFKTSEKKSVTIVTATATRSEGVIILNLFYNGNKHLAIYQTNDKAAAFKMAEKLRKLLDIDVLDATEQEKKWVEAV